MKKHFIIFSTSNKSYFETNLLFLLKRNHQPVILDSFGLWGTHAPIGTGSLSKLTLKTTVDYFGVYCLIVGFCHSEYSDFN